VNETSENKTTTTIQKKRVEINRKNKKYVKIRKKKKIKEEFVF